MVYTTHDKGSTKSVQLLLCTAPRFILEQVVSTTDKAIDYYVTCGIRHLHYYGGCILLLVCLTLYCSYKKYQEYINNIILHHIQHLCCLASSCFLLIWLEFEGHGTDLEVEQWIKVVSCVKYTLTVYNNYVHLYCTDLKTVI